MLETIKSYLVSLGFAVDNNSYNEATKAMDNAGKNVAKFAGGAVREFAIAGTAVTSFVAAASFGLAKFVGDLAQADLANEKLARQMWTSKDNAAAYNNTLKAMGVSLQDLYLSPELMRNFQTLRDQSNNMRPPQEFNEQMKMIRSIQFEFTRMKLEATYALQWIGYYFIKYMGGPLRDIKKTLGDINGTIVKTMPSWTKVIAQVMSWFAQMGITTVRAFKDIGRVFDDIGKGIPKNLKLIGAAVAALALIIQTGPIGIITATLTGALLLLNDFYTYLDGGESAFGPMWKKLIDFYNKLKDSGAIDAFKNKFKEALDAVSKTVDSAIKGISDFISYLEKHGVIDDFKDSVKSAMDMVSSLGDAVLGSDGWIQRIYKTLRDSGDLAAFKQNILDLVGAIKDLSGSFSDLLKSDFGKNAFYDIGTLLKSLVVPALQTASDLINSINHGLHGLSSLFKGDMGGVWDQVKSWGKDYKDRTWDRSQQSLNELKGNNGNVEGSMLDQLKVWVKNFKDRTWDQSQQSLNELKGNMFPNPNNSNNPSNPPGYMYPQSNTHNTKTNKVSLSQTNNIYGSDPKATADAAQNNMDAMYLRNMRGVIG